MYALTTVYGLLNIETVVEELALAFFNHALLFVGSALVLCFVTCCRHAAII